MQTAIEKLSKLPEKEQDVYAHVIIEELDAERQWDTAFAGTQDRRDPGFPEMPHQAAIRCPALCEGVLWPVAEASPPSWPALQAVAYLGADLLDTCRSALPDAGRQKGRAHDLVLDWEPR